MNNLSEILPVEGIDLFTYGPNDLAQSMGHAFHITSDEVLTWNQIYSIIGKAAGAEPHLIHVPSDFISCFDPVTGSGLLGDKAWSVVFDNTKIKTFVPDYVATVPFSKGVRDAIAWIDGDEIDKRQGTLFQMDEQDSRTKPSSVRRKRRR